MTQPEPESQPDPLLRAALDGYLSAMADIAEAVLAMNPEVGAACHEQLTRLRARLLFQPDLKTLEESRTAIHEALAEFSGRARRYSEALTNELNRVLATFGQQGDARSVRYVSHLLDFVDQMEHAVRSANFGRLIMQAGELRTFAESIELDTREDYTQLRTKVTDFQDRLREAERLASLDPLTGMANRREFDRQLAARIHSKQQFCVLLFDLDRFKLVNDQFGHLCGDDVLKQVGARLRAQVRPGDFVCRWGGDEFVILLNCPLDHAQARSHQIAQSLTGIYIATVEAGEKAVELSVSSGVAQYVEDEDPTKLFHRVDDSMYGQKR